MPLYRTREGRLRHAALDQLQLRGTGGAMGGSVTSVGAGDGITATPNPIVGAGSIAVDGTVVRTTSGALITEETPAGGLPGTAFTLSGVPVRFLLLIVDGLVQMPAGSPGQGEFSRAGAAITMGWPVQSGSTIRAWWA